MDEERKRRSQWLVRHVLPNEAMVRVWLQAQRFPGVDVDDVIQEMYSHLSSVNSVDHIRQPRAYVFQVAKAIVMDELRRARVVSIQSVVDLDAVGAVDPQPSPETQAGDRQELRFLAEAIAGLAGRKRDVFILRKVHGLAQKEVAQKLGLSESAVENHVARAIEALGTIIGRGKRGVGTPLRQVWRAPQELKVDDAEPRDQSRNL